jgi:hypothetical protein
MICFNIGTIGQTTQLFGPLFNKIVTLSMTFNFNWWQLFVAFYFI